MIAAALSGEQWLAAGAVLAAIITAAGTVISARRASRRMADIEARKLEGAEFDRNKAITDSIIANLRAEVDRLKVQVGELLVALDREEAENQQLRELVRKLTETANDLRHTIRVLEMQIQGNA